jgi:hypothetical protein
MTSQRPELAWRPDWLAEWPGHVSLIEPSIGSTFGVPDVSLVARGFDPGWNEFKWMDEDGRFVLRPEQRAWMRDFIRHSSRCAITVMNELGFLTIPIREVLRGPYQSSYSAPSLPSIVGWIEWKDIHLKELPKLLELTYVSAK